MPMNSMRFLCSAAVPLLAATLAPAAHAQMRADSAALVTVLGRDTLALERWVQQPGRITAEAVVRSPRTTLRRYVAELADDGMMTAFEEHTYLPSAPDEPVRSETWVRAGEGWTRTLTEGDSTRASQVSGPAAALPFVDLVHWPFNLVVARAPGQGGTQPLFSGGRMMNFTVAPAGAGAWTLTHPMRGPSVARVDASGRMVSLDAAGTTRKVVVTRVPWLGNEMQAAAARWEAADRAGRGMGELSGRGREEETLSGARIVIDYGQPVRRGRDIFPAVVRWGQLWRTGANRATHLTTDRALVLGEGANTLRVPAGEYTLFSMPAEDGGVLIVNRQTGQNGTSYDAARDVGRVPMRREAIAAPVETFTIDVVPGAAGAGTLRLSWDRTAFVIPVRVEP